ncbi:MAG: hypothetical protein E5Y12_00760 [Mesorhizobium sp.]|nr:MAG: hypothetical protein E5Y12_00760 [Mesorhizobium sp.]
MDIRSSGQVCTAHHLYIRRLSEGAMLRKQGPYLGETECQPIDVIVDVAGKWGLFVAIDIHER